MNSNATGSAELIEGRFVVGAHAFGDTQLQVLGTCSAAGWLFQQRKSFPFDAPWETVTAAQAERIETVGHELVSLAERLRAWFRSSEHPQLMSANVGDTIDFLEGCFTVGTHARRDRRLYLQGRRHFSRWSVVSSSTVSSNAARKELTVTHIELVGHELVSLAERLRNAIPESECSFLLNRCA